MICWEKCGIFNAPKEVSKLTCHPHLSTSTLMGHTAGRVHLLQTFPTTTLLGVSFCSLSPFTTI